MAESLLKKIKDKLSDRKSEVDLIYDNLIEGTNSALSDFTTDEISILNARVDKIELDLARPSSLSFSQFALELVLTVAFGPIFKYLTISPIVTKSTEKAIQNSMALPNFVIKFGEKAPLSTKYVLEQLSPWTVNGIQLTQALTKAEIEILKGAKKKTIELYSNLIKDSLSEAIKKTGSTIPKVISAKANVNLLNNIGSNYLATTIALNIKAKLIKYKNSYALYNEKLKNELDSIEDKSILEKRIKELNENIKSIDEQLKDKSVDPTNISEITDQWRALIRQFIWVNLIGKSDTIGRIRETSDVNEQARSGFGRGAIIKTYTDGSGYYFVSDIYNKNLADRLIKTLPTENDNFLDRALNHRKNSKVVGYRIPENITLDFIDSNPSYGRIKETATEPSILSVKDMAYKNLFNWLDNYNNELIKQSNSFFQLMEKFDQINSTIKIEEF